MTALSSYPPEFRAEFLAAWERVNRYGRSTGPNGERAGTAAIVLAKPVDSSPERHGFEARDLVP